MPPLSIFTYSLVVPQSAIDEYGHVNNVIYVQWMQDAAIRHPESIPEYRQPENTGWFAREHRIEYLAPAYLGDEIEVRTWIADSKRVRAQRRYEFIRKADGKLIARGETQWIFVELATGRPTAIPPEIQALFPLVPDKTGAADPIYKVLRKYLKQIAGFSRVSADQSSDIHARSSRRPKPSSLIAAEGLLPVKYP